MLRISCTITGVCQPKCRVIFALFLSGMFVSAAVLQYTYVRNSIYARMFVCMLFVCLYVVLRINMYKYIIRSMYARMIRWMFMYECLKNVSIMHS